MRTDRWFEHIEGFAAPPGWKIRASHRRIVLEEAGAALLGPSIVHSDNGREMFFTRRLSGTYRHVLTRAVEHDSGWFIRGVVDELAHLDVRTARVAVANMDRLLIAAVQRTPVSPTTLCLYRRTATSGAWTLQSELPVLREHAYVSSPSLVCIEGSLHLWYALRNEKGDSVHLARSQDGVNWEASGAVLRPGALGAADHDGILGPFVQTDADGLLMVYRGANSGSIMWATSPDGVNWQKCGHLLFAGSLGSPDEQAIADPCITGRLGDGADLYYAGQAVDSNWRIVHEHIPRSAFTTNVETYQPSELALARARDLWADHSPDTFDLRLGLAKTAPSPENVDTDVHQLFPSSGPVFAVGVQPHREIIKFGRSPKLVEREYDRNTRLREYVSVAPAALRYVCSRPVLIMPELIGPTAQALAQSDAAAFGVVARELVERTLDATARTLVPYDGSTVEFSTQTPNHLIARLFSVGQLRGNGSRIDGLLGARVFVQDTLYAESTYPEIHRSLQHLHSPPEQLAYFEGDLKLGHVVRTANAAAVLLDTEHAGWLDNNWIVHTLVTALLGDGEALYRTHAQARDGELRITIREGEHPLLADEEFRRRFVAGLVNARISPSRVRAYHAATMAHLLVGHEDADSFREHLRAVVRFWILEWLWAGAFLPVSADRNDHESVNMCESQPEAV